ncbi:MAG: ribosome assembly factor SBDS [archaeon]|nr:ribosome assembly factor SBDS [archaeon]
MSEKITLARIKKYGETFEISVDPDKALQYKKGLISDIQDVLLANNIFTDAHKGEVASHGELENAFKTTNIDKIAEIILKEGEIQLTAEHRAHEREQKLKKLITLISRQAVDPKTGFPHPPTRIEAALEQGKIHLDDRKTIEEQFDDIISKLRPIIPIKIEQKKLLVTIPAQHTGKAYNIVKSNSKILKENWNNDGSWSAEIELPAGFIHEFMDKVNTATHGEAMMEQRT